MEKNLNRFKIKLSMRSMSIKIVYLVLLISIFSTLSFSQNIVVEIPKYTNIIAGETTKIPIKIFNYENYRVRVFLTLFPYYYEGILTYIENNEIYLDPKSSFITYLTIKVPLNVRDKTVTYKLFVDYEDPFRGKVTNIYEFVVGVIARSEIRVEGFGINDHIFKPNDKIHIYISYRNLKEFATNIKLNIQLIYSGKTLIWERNYTLNLLPFESKNFTYYHAFSYNDLPGDYSFIITSYDESGKLLSKLSFDVKLEEIRKIVKDRKVESGFLKYSVEIYLRNDGNVKEEVEVSERIPYILKPFVVFENSNPEFKDEIVTWKIILNPQEEVSIRYSILYFIPLFLTSLIALFAFFYYFFVVLVPKYRKQVELKEDIYKIKILLRNTSRKRMKNIEIRDFVPSLFKILSFETLKPEIKKGKDGFELIWKIKELKPGEEVLISYKVKPLIEIIGKVNFSKPKVKYVLR